MTIEDNILDFLDGNLSSYDEEELLHRLAVSPERRAVLKQHLQVRELSSALANKHNYVVPKAITAQLFHTLAASGYAGPIIHTSADHAATLEQSLLKNLERSAQTLTSHSKRFTSSSLLFLSIASFLVGASLMYFFIPGSFTTNSPMMAGVSSPTLQSNTAVPKSGDAIGASGETIAAGTNTFIDRTQTPTPSSDNRVGANTITETYSNADGNTLNPVSVRVDEKNLSFAVRQTQVTLSNASVNNDVQSTDLAVANNVYPQVNVQNALNINAATPTKEYSINSLQQIPVTTLLPRVASRNWYDGDGIRSSDIGSEHSLKGRFGYEADDESSSFVERTTVSLRSGVGQAPGNQNMISASLVEMKFSADITDWLVAKVSFGQFMPYETEATNKGLNSDGVRQLKLEPILQYKSIVGAEIGVRYKLFGLPFEMMAGLLSDMEDAVIPRASIFSSWMLQENLSVHIGVEAMFYQHDIRRSLRDAQTLFATDHPVLLSTLKEKELTGFIGPAIELAWHF